MSLLQKHMKPHCVHYILYRDIGYGTLCSTALSIGVVSARGLYDIKFYKIYIDRYQDTVLRYILPERKPRFLVGWVEPLNFVGFRASTQPTKINHLEELNLSGRNPINAPARINVLNSIKKRKNNIFDFLS